MTKKHKLKQSKLPSNKKYQAYQQMVERYHIQASYMLPILISAFFTWYHKFILIYIVWAMAALPTQVEVLLPIKKLQKCDTDTDRPYAIT